ncbi:MAG TPA: lysophospholipid acyltransferase family protein [Anaerolineales bacterium]|nr:lysophospholipid acyltransferase family protein [Anaerolineales bacterium]
MVRDRLRQVLFFLFRTLTRLEIVGEENIPESGGCLLALNHLSRLDAPLVFSILKRKDSTGLVADKYKNYPIFNWIVETAQGIWLDRDNPDFGALRAAVKFLRAGGVIGIAPEGTRSSTQSLMQPKAGVAFLAVKANVPIVPIAIMGTEKTIHNLLRLRRSPIRIQFGQPFTLSLPAKKEKDAALNEAADEIMCQIARYLMPPYWGVYADHPRLQALLAENGHVVEPFP